MAQVNLDEFEVVRRLPSTDIRTAGRVFYGMGETAAYAAARKGDIPTLRIGRKLIVPVRRVLEQLGIE